MDLAAIAIKNRVVTLVLTAVLLLAGASSYENMSRLEDPEFTIKDALVMTPYPGASAQEVEQQVSDYLEIAVQQLRSARRSAVQVGPWPVDADGIHQRQLRQRDAATGVG